MLKVTSINAEAIVYRCDCGAKGKCHIKPMSNDTAVNLECALCGETQVVFLTIHDREDLNNVFLSWSPILTNEVIKDE